MTQLATEQFESEIQNPDVGLSGDRDEISLLDLLIVLARRKRMICGVTIIVAVAATVVSLLLPSRYTATSSILPPQQSQSVGSALLSQVAGAGALATIAGKDLGIKNPNDLYVAMLQSRTVEESVIAQFELMKVYRSKRLSDARLELESNSDILSGKDGLIRISIEDKDPKRAAAIANFYVEQLQKLTSTLALTEAGQRRLFFERQLEKAKDALAGAERALQETQQKTGIIQLDSQAKAIIETVARVRAQIAAKEIQLQTMQTFATDNNPDYVLLKQELVGLHTQLSKLESQENVGSGDLQVPTGKVPELGLEYVRRLREVKYQENIYEFLAKQFEVAKIDEARQGSIIQVVDRAVEPDKKSSPKRRMIILFATLSGFFVAMFAALLSEAWTRVRSNPEQRERLETLKSLWFRSAGT